MKSTYVLNSKISVYPGIAAWRFLAIPVEEAREIKERYGKQAKGWGSLPVVVTIGKTKWNTSIFPDRKSGTYLLPLKGQVRKVEGIEDADTVVFTLSIR